MPITSAQVNGMIGGQQAMFGNFASYSQQISPGYGGPPPGYSNPMGGMGNPLQSTTADSMGAGSVSGIGSHAASALGTGALAGSIGLGMMRNPIAQGMSGALGMMDPMTAGFSGFARGSGVHFGGHGMFSGAG